MPPKRTSAATRKKLSNLASRNYVSEKGLASILKDVKAHIELLEQSSRSSIKRAREDAVNVSSLEGKLLRRMTIGYDDDPTIGLEFTYIHPISMLTYAINHCQEFREAFCDRHCKQPSTIDKPWTIVLYSDEVTLGDPLSKAKGSRKVQAIYWSLKELGPDILACDASWFVLTVLRSNVVKPLGGLSVLTRHLLETFFEDGSKIDTGVKCGPHLLFADIGMIVQDYDAVKYMMESKGASGIIVCFLCQNCIDHKKTDVWDGITKIPSTELDMSKFRKHNANSISDASQF